ncbi:MAG: DNA polymerase III subunit delta [Firmicutes bacterium]|nr:DNA polymerase III subunit delta [Bacillota bacterium]
MKPRLLYGDEKYLVNRRLAEICAKLLPPGAELMNRDFFEGKAVPARQIIDAALTAPFLAETRVVVVSGSGLFSPGRKDDSEHIARFLDETPESTALIFAEDGVDRRGKLYKKLAEQGEVAEFKTPGEKDMINWICGEAEKAGKTLTRSCAAVLLRTVAQDMYSVKNELGKLTAYVGERREIAAADVGAVCSPSLAARVFDLTDAVGGKNVKAALDIYNNMLIMREEPLRILSMIARQFRIMLQCAGLAAKGFGMGEISDRLSLRGFAAEEYLRQGAGRTLRDMRKALEDCLETDVAVKTGLVGDRLGVEMLILRLSGGYNNK